MDDLLNEFLTETNESLGTLDVELVRFEREPSDATIL
jgi:two-component system chemotaxis sensor kinase CheA